MVKLEVIGFLGSDAEHRTPNDKSVLNFTVCSNDMIAGKEWKTWVQCSWWDPPMQMVSRLAKGAQVVVYGFPSVSGYINSYNKVTGTLRLNVDECHVINAAKVPEDKFAEMKEEIAKEEPTAEPPVPIEEPAPKGKKTTTSKSKTSKK